MAMQMQANVNATSVNSEGNYEKAVLKMADIVKSPNLVPMLPVQEVADIGRCVVAAYNRDMYTRQEWEQRNEQGIKLALQVVEVKSFPWTNCSNAKFPLLTIAALQFLARVSILTKGRRLAKLEVIGADPDGKKNAQASRISDHMSLQLTEDDRCWVDDDEKTKLATSLIGSGFKKTLYDTVSGIQTTEYVPAMNFVVDYYCKDLPTANRVTHLLSMNSNKIQERVRRKLFVEMTEEPASSTATTTNLLQITSDEAAGLKRPASAEEYEILEQHCWYDFDGDGYEEPYIMFVRKDTEQVLRIVARYYDAGDVHRVNDAQVRELEQELQDTKVPDDNPLPTMDKVSKLEKQIDRLKKAADNFIVRIDAKKYFDKYTFIPSPDGGFYGLGLGALLGPSNEVVNTLFNQLVDAGTMSNSGGGFLGRGVKMKGGKSSFDPFEWKPVDSTGDDLRKNVFPLPVREPSNVLFQLLGLLITYSEKISGATDIMTGVSPGQNTPAETSRNTVEQGMMLFSGIYSRMYRSFKEELSTRFENNRLFLESSPQFWELTKGPNAILSPDDYKINRFRIYPMADVSSASQSQRQQRAQMLQQLASAEPGFNKYLVTKNLLEVFEYENIDQIYPDPKGPNAIAPPQNPKVELEKAKLQQQQQEHSDNMQLEIADTKSSIELNGAKIMELQAKATKELAEASGVDTGHQIAMIEAQIGAAKLKQEGLLGALSALQKAHETQMKLSQASQGMQDKAAAGKKEPTNGAAAPQPQEG